MTVATKAISTSRELRKLMSSPLGQVLERRLGRELQIQISEPLTSSAPEGYRGLRHSPGRESPAAPRQLPRQCHQQQ